jgi:opacity protein-like surface antigen
MKKLLTTTLLLCASSTAAYADGLVGGVGLTRLSLENAGIDIGMNALQGTVGYQMDFDGFSLTPEFRLGTGIQDAEFGGVNFDIKNYYGVNLRAAMEVGNVYGFISPSYTHYKLGGSAAGSNFDGSNGDLGVGVGAGYRFSGNLSAEASYEWINDVDIVGVGLRLTF